MTSEEAFGKVLREIRHEHSLSQEELGFKSNYHRTYISLLERGSKKSMVDTINCTKSADGITLTNQGRYSKMKKNYYLLEVEGGVEPIAHGPYHTKHERDNAARQFRRMQQEDDGLFWADVDEAGTLAVGTYTAGFFWQDSTEDCPL